jgi:hypothetical protein
MCPPLPLYFSCYKKTYGLCVVQQNSLYHRTIKVVSTLSDTFTTSTYPLHNSFYCNKHHSYKHGIKKLILNTCNKWKRVSGLRFEVAMAAKMSSMVFWVMRPCYLLGGYQRFGGRYQLTSPWKWKVHVHLRR